MPELEFRAAEPFDAPALSQLFRDVYGRVRSAEHYRWKFFAPLRDYAGERVWVAESDGRLVGSTAILPYTIWLGGKTEVGAALVEVHVAKEFRRQGVQSRLHELLVAGLAKNGARYSLSMPNQESIHFLHSAAYHELFPAIWLRRKVSLLENVFARPHRDRTVREIESPGSECEVLWGRLSHSLDCCTIPSPARLAYRFRQNPDSAYTILLAEDRTGPCGLLVFGSRWFGKRREAVVANVYTTPGDIATLRSLTDAAARLARQQGFRGLRTIVSKGPIVDTWAEAGFHQVQGEFLAHVLPISPPVVPPQMQDPAVFSIQLGDHDFV